MQENILNKVEKLIDKKKIDEAQFELSKLDQNYHTNPQYLYLRSKIFFLNKLYYVAIDTLLIALEFEKNEKFYKLIAQIYATIDNANLSKKILDLNLREKTVSLLKDDLSGIFRKNR